MLQLIMASLLVAAPVKTTAVRPTHVVAMPNESALAALDAKERPLAIELQHLFGCRGDWRQAVTVRPLVNLRTVRKLEPSHFAASGGPLDELPRHACLADFAEAQPPCPYCEEYSCEAGLDEVSEEERQRFYRERDQYYSDQQSASANEIAAHGRFVETVAGLFSAQPLIKVTLRNRSLTVRGARSLYVFAFSVRVSGGCNDGTLSAEISEATVAPIVVPAIRAGGSAEVIFRVPQYVNTFYGVLEAPDLTTARARARARAEDVSRELRDQAMTSSTEKTVTIRPGEAWTHRKICCCYRV